MQRNDKPKKMPRKLEKAIKKNDIATVKTILADKKYQDPQWLNAVNGRGRTPLLLALKYKRLEIAKLLLTYPATNVNARDYYGDVYYWARDNLEIVNLLLDDSRIALNYDQVERLLDRYCYNDSAYLTLLQKLIAKGVSVNITFGDLKRSALWWACCRGQESVVKFLLAQPGIDVNKKAPLAEIYRSSCNPAIVKLLLAIPHIDVNCRGTLERTAIDQALMWKEMNAMNADTVECIKLLLCDPRLDRKWIKHCGSDLLEWLRGVSQKSFNNVITLASTQLTKVVNKKHGYYESKNNLKININLVDAVNVLINDPEFDINALYSNGQTLLTLFICNGRDDIVDLLLACPRIKLYQQDQSGHSALTQADALGKQDIVDKIMHHPRFKLQATYHHNQNLLMHAAEYDRVGLVKTLLTMNEFPVDQVDDSGNTALNLLAQHHKNPQDASLFIEFLRNGADPTLRNSLGTNAIMSAENSNLKGIASDLKNTAQPVIQQFDQDPKPSAPPMSADQSVCNSFITAVQQQPQCYYERGLFGASVNSVVQPQQEASHTDSLDNQTHSLLY